MKNLSPVQPNNESYSRDYHRDGFVILPDFFDADLIQGLRSEADRLWRDETQLVSKQNARCRFMPSQQTGQPLFECFDPVKDLSAIIDQIANANPLHRVLEQIYEEPACLFKDKLIFKPPQAKGYPLHQDIPLGWSGFPRTFLSVLIPIDACDQTNGCTQVFAGYHAAHLSPDPKQYMLDDELVDEARVTYLELKPGDAAIFHGLTPHRSAPNRSRNMRRTLYLSYNARSDGGDQRHDHYQQFINQMVRRIEFESGTPAFFR